MTDSRVLAYLSHMRGRFLLILAAVVILIVASILSIIICPIKISPVEAFTAFFKHLSGTVPENYHDYLVDYHVWNNLPRAICAILAGAILACGGAAMQSMIRNPLADPYTLGISSGALFGMVIWTILGISLIPFASSGDAPFFNAFLMALVPTFIVLAMSLFKKVSPTTMILCGIGVMYVFNAFTTILKYSTDSDTLKDLYLWTVGSINGLVWGSLPKLALAFLISFIPMMLYSKHLDIVSQGDTNAVSLGVNPNRTRIIFMVIISISVAIVVCYTGTIGFVGLIAPHIARILVGSRCIVLVPCSAVLGGIMVFGADCIVRLFFPALSVGVILAVVCSPIFIYILMRMKRSAW